jgi:hypothetical protein
MANLPERLDCRLPSVPDVGKTKLANPAHQGGRIATAATLQNAQKSKVLRVIAKVIDARAVL